MTSYGHRISIARKAKGLTQEQLALAIGVTRATINNLEAGRSMGRGETRAALGEALGVYPDNATEATAERVRCISEDMADMQAQTRREQRRLDALELTVARILDAIGYQEDRT